MLSKGEFQVSEEERQAQVEQLFRDVVTRVTDMCVVGDLRTADPARCIDPGNERSWSGASASSRIAAQSALSKLLLIISRRVYRRGLNRILRSRYGHGNHGTT